MSPLDVRAADPGLGSGPTKSLASSRQDAGAGFDDAFDAAGEQSTATKKDGDADTRSRGKEFSWDPRMKDAQIPANDQNDAADDVQRQMPVAETGISVPHDVADGEAAAGENRNKDDDDKKEEKIAVIVVPMNVGPDVTPSTTVKGADANTGAQAGSALPPAKADLLSRQTASKAEKPGEPVSENRQPLVARVSEDQPKGSVSALATLSSRLAELTGEENSAPKAEASRADSPKVQITPSGGTEPVSKPQDSNAVAAKTDAADGLAAALRLPGVPPEGSRNVSAIATGIVSSPAWTQALASSADVTAARTAGPINALRIQLHPADLGVVTATLRLSGDHLVINLTVETAAAYRQLSADNRAIVDKLKGHGYVVESIAVQHVAGDRPVAPQPQQAAGLANQHAGGQAGPGGGGQPFDGNSGSRGGNSHFSDEQAASVREAANPADAAGRAAGGIYV